MSQINKQQPRTTVLVHFNILEKNAEIQIANGKSSRTNGRITVTARIEAMLALCADDGIAIHVSSEICANFVRIDSTL